MVLRMYPNSDHQWTANSTKGGDVVSLPPIFFLADLDPTRQGDILTATHSPECSYPITLPVPECGYLTVLQTSTRAKQRYI